MLPSLRTMDVSAELRLHEPPKAIQVLEVLDAVSYGSLASGFVVPMLELLLPPAAMAPAVPATTVSPPPMCFRPFSAAVTPWERLVAAHGPFMAAVMLARAEASCSPAQARRLLASLPARRASGSFFEALLLPLATWRSEQ